MFCDELPLYLRAPRAICPASKIEDLAYARLRRLYLLSDASKAVHIAGGSETEVEEDDEQHEHVDLEEDAIGHFALRLAFCSTHALRSWLIKQELALFAQRWRHSSIEGKQHALTDAGFETARDGDDRRLYCEVPFFELPPMLLARRRVTLCCGMARVDGHENLEVLLVRWFEKQLQSSLAKGALMPEILQDNPPLVDIIGHLRACGERLLVAYEARHEARGSPGLAEDGNGGIGLTLQNFEEILRQSFPPCMRHLVLHQRMGQHLKFLGRLQLRPFLREAGLGLSSAVRWWERELCRDPCVTPVLFRQKYAYQVEHAHGGHGHGRGAFAYSCKKLIGFQAPSPGRVHGCPFQNLPSAELAYLLPFWGVPQSMVGPIVERSVAEGPTSACAEFFAATHPGASRDLLRPANHPNEFLRRSRRAFKAAMTVKIELEHPAACNTPAVPERITPSATAVGMSLPETANVPVMSIPTPSRSIQMPSRLPADASSSHGCERPKKRPALSVAKLPLSF